MEEMNNQVIENINEEVIEGVTEQLTLGQTCASYALAGVIAVGAVTTVYLAGKGASKLIKHFKDKKKYVEEPIDNEEAIDIDECDVHEVNKDDETEEN